MQRTLAILIAISMLGIMATAPTVSAGEQVTEDYTGSGGFYAAGVGGLGISWRPCPPGYCDLDEDGTQDIPDVKISGGPLIAQQGVYTNVIVNIKDDVYGAVGGFSACFMNPDGDNVCETGDGTLDGVQDAPSGVGCGTKAILGAHFSSDRVTTFIYLIVVEEDLTTCGGSTGTTTGDFF